MPSVIAEQYLYRFALRIACEIDKGINIALLKSCIQNPEIVSNHLGFKLLIVVNICEPVGDSFEFRGPEGANVADLVEEMTAYFKVLFDNEMQAGLLETIFYFKEICYILQKIVHKVFLAFCFRLEESILVDELGVEGELIYKGMYHTVNVVLQLSGVVGT